jgi:predicted metal-binding membrane protein
MSSERAFFGVSALVFAAAAAATIVWGTSMSAMAGMPMPGNWTMSMAWMPMCGRTWSGTAASFLGMWIAMMAAMMLPSLVPMLQRFRRAVGGTGETRLAWLTALAGAGYFFVWTLIGMAVFPLGVALAKIEMDVPALARAVPLPVSLSWSRAHSSSLRGRPVTWPAAGRPRSVPICYRRTPAQPGDTGCSLASIAASAVPA